MFERLSKAGQVAVSVPIAFLAIIIDLYLLVNGSNLFQSAFQTGEVNTHVLEIYLLMDGAVLFIVPFQKSQFINVKAPDLIFWVLGFFFTGILIGNVYKPLIPVHSATYELAALVFEIFVVTFSETWIFLGAIQTFLMQRKVKLAFLWQGIAFGLFHYTAYGGDVFAMIQAIAFGTIMGLIYYATWSLKKPDEGLALAWGIHSGWNVALLTTLFLFL